MSLQSEYYLSHYGVLGMKWGVRKARKDLKVQKKAHKRAIKDADSREARDKAKQDYKDFKKGGRTKGQRFADAMFANSKDVRAYMSQGKSHKEAFLRSMADSAVTGAAVAALSNIGRVAARRAIAKKTASAIPIEKLKEMGISVFEPERVNISRVDISHIGR